MTRALVLLGLMMPAVGWAATPIQRGSNLGLGIGGGEGLTGLSVKYFIGSDFALQGVIGVWNPLGFENQWLLADAPGFSPEANGFGFNLDALFESQPWISGSAVDLAFDGGLGVNAIPTGIGPGSDWLGISLVGGFEVDIEAIPVDLVFEYRPNLWLMSGLGDGGWTLGDNLDWFAFVLHVRVYPFPAGPEGSAPPPG